MCVRARVYTHTRLCPNKNDDIRAPPSPSLHTHTLNSKKTNKKKHSNKLTNRKTKQKRLKNCCRTLQITDPDCHENCHEDLSRSLSRWGQTLTVTKTVTRTCHGRCDGGGCHKPHDASCMPVASTHASARSHRHVDSLTSCPN